MNREPDFPVWPGWETVRVIGRGSFGAREKKSAEAHELEARRRSA